MYLLFPYLFSLLACSSSKPTESSTNSDDTGDVTTDTDTSDTSPTPSYYTDIAPFYDIDDDTYLDSSVQDDSNYSLLIGGGYPDTPPSVLEHIANNLWDCDDLNPDVHPEVEETCNNGIDDNCDGSVNECEISSGTLWEVADILLFGKEAGDRAGMAIAAGGDLDLNGQLDVLVSSPYSNGSTGAADIAFGPFTADVDLGSTGVRFVGSEANSYFGYQAKNVGDITRDGADDVLVSAPWSDSGAVNGGAVYLFAGPFAPNEDGSVRELGIGDAIASSVGATANAVLGRSITTFGDDVVISEMGYGASGVYSDGAVYLFGQSDDGVYRTKATLLGSTYDSAGAFVESGGDVDGDGIDELLVGAPFNAGLGGYKTVDYSWAQMGSGAIYVVSGIEIPSSGTVSLADVSLAKLLGAVAGEYLGISGDLADIDHDGHADILAGSMSRDRDANLNEEGAAYLFYGPVSGDTSVATAAYTVLGESRGQNVGVAVSMPGDVDGDNEQDLLIGANDGGYGGSKVGAACLALGTGARFTGTVDFSSLNACFAGATEDDLVGNAVAGLGDLNGDGRSDIAVGAYGYQSGSFMGLAGLIFGTGR